ncbi:Ig-like domain-containing protein [Micromonospora narathiwatensis]|uniref:LPXTG-motif cell wall anchor domain-containing protein n=1 Tax=Micromonospora narathiwatensis TaxID=299146 RepID=A0A1A9ACR2_9ACTN|nr:Ig-like domain-containing protein [Micromonospora narathiwatensis]SBT53903.1 LPXTG-motif cell wall anchor domain-containing protein [Micromonospora narathiwatensis]
MSLSVSRRGRIAAALSAATLLGGMLVGLVATPAYAADLGTVNLSQSRGTVTANPMFETAITSKPCPKPYGEEAALRIGPGVPTGPFTNLTPSLGGGGYDEAPVTANPNRSMQTALGEKPADGTYWVVVECFSLLAGRNPDRFVTPIKVTGENWEVVSSNTQTTTTLAVSPADSAVQGSAVTLTATIDPPAATGSIQFRDGETALGAPVTVSGGTATLTTRDLSVGLRALSAVFNPTGNFDASISSAASYRITAPGAQDVTIELEATPASPQPQKTPVTLTARVTPATTGHVQFRRGTDPIASIEVSADGTATTTVNTASAPLLVGAHTFTAEFIPTNPDEFNGAQSAPVQYEITGDGVAQTTTKLEVSPAGPKPQGTAVTLTATVQPAAAAGKVQFNDGSTALGEAVTVQNGTATTTVTTLPVGVHSLTAVFTPSDATQFSNSTSQTVQYEITAPATDSDLTVTDEDGKKLGANPTLYPGQTVQIEARGFTGDEPVVLQLDGTTVQTVPAENGVVGLTFTLGEDSRVGAHQLVFSGTAHTVTFDFTVAAKDDDPADGDDNNSDGDGGNGGTGGGSLPKTGVDVVTMLGAGLMLVGGGAGVLVMTRRRPRFAPVIWPDEQR